MMHLKRSIPPHSLTIVTQNPRRNAKDEVVELMVKINSAISLASACCTSGLSDIQKPAETRSVIQHRLVNHHERRTVEYSFPKFRHFDVRENIL
jgi:hypothetical protein